MVVVVVYMMLATPVKEEEGEVEMERCMSLSDEEVEDEHLRLTCVATPTSDTLKIVYNAKEIDLLKDRVI